VGEKDIIDGDERKIGYYRAGLLQCWVDFYILYQECFIKMRRPYVDQINYRSL